MNYCKLFNAFWDCDIVHIYPRLLLICMLVVYLYYVMASDDVHVPDLCIGVAKIFAAGEDALISF